MARGEVFERPGRVISPERLPRRADAVAFANSVRCPCLRLLELEHQIIRLGRQRPRRGAAADVDRGLAAGSSVFTSESTPAGRAVLLAWGAHSWAMCGALDTGRARNAAELVGGSWIAASNSAPGAA